VLDGGLWRPYGAPDEPRTVGRANARMVRHTASMRDPINPDHIYPIPGCDDSIHPPCPQHPPHRSMLGPLNTLSYVPTRSQPQGQPPQQQQAAPQQQPPGMGAPSYGTLQQSDGGMGGPVGGVPQHQSYQPQGPSQQPAAQQLQQPQQMGQMLGYGQQAAGAAGPYGAGAQYGGGSGAYGGQGMPMGGNAPQAAAGAPQPAANGFVPVQGAGCVLIVRRRPPPWCSMRRGTAIRTGVSFRELDGLTLPLAARCK